MEFPRTYEKKISVIVNNYNYARFLRSAIDSALAQAYSNLEVVVVDDGSTDDSRSLINSYGAAIKAIYKTNGGQGSAMNAGFAAATGDIIIFLDADDTLRPACAAEVVANWKADLARVQYSLQRIDQKGVSFGSAIEVALATGHDAKDALTRGPLLLCPPTSGMAFARSALEQMMPMPEAPWCICADIYLTALSPFIGEVISIPQTLGAYRVHGSNATAKDFSPESLRRAFGYGREIYDAIQQLAPETLPSYKEWLASSHRHLLYRIASLRTAPRQHPFEESLRELVRTAFKSAWATPGCGLVKRTSMLALTVTIATAPRGMLMWLLNPQRPSTMLKRFREREAQPGV